MFSAFGGNIIEKVKVGTLKRQCHLDKNDSKNRVYRNMYPVLFLCNIKKVLTGEEKYEAALTI